MEVDIIFEECVGSDDDGDISILEPGFDVFFLLRGESADKEIGGDTETREELYRAREMLSREDFGWGEDGNLYSLSSLLTFEYRMDSGDEDDDGFTGSDISLEEALHRVGPFHILEDLEEDNLLTTGQLVWQMIDDFFDEFCIEWDGDRSTLTEPLSFFLPEESRVLEIEEFLVRELRSRTFEIWFIRRKMNREEIFFFTSESFFLPDLFGNNLGNRPKIFSHE